MMRYLYIDDDEDYSLDTIENLENKFPVLRGNADLILSEKRFLEKLSFPDEFHYEFVILDIMVRWTNEPDENRPEPDLVRGGYLQAGARILNRLRKHPGGADLPVIVHTARSYASVQAAMKEWDIATDHLTFARKWGDLHELCEKVERQLLLNR